MGTSELTLRSHSGQPSHRPKAAASLPALAHVGDPTASPGAPSSSLEWAERIGILTIQIDSSVLFGRVVFAPVAAPPERHAQLVCGLLRSEQTKVLIVSDESFECLAPDDV